MRDNNTGVAKGGPVDGETLSFWKETIGESTINVARPFSGGVNAHVVNVDRAWNRGSYQWDASTETWVWENSP